MLNENKIKLWLYRVVNASLLVATFLSVYYQNWLILFLVFSAFIIITYSKKITILSDFDYPSEIEIAVVIFIYASIFLGEITSFYVRFWWWDLALHAFSSILIALIAFLLIFVLNQKNKKNFSLSPIFASLFVFSFAVAVGAIWKIFEFIMDQTLGLNMQKSGLFDTMSDLILDASGAFLVALSAYFYLKTGSINIISRVFNRFFQKNSVYLYKNKQ